MSEIIGREQEREILEKILQSKEPAFLALYGRRRVGKTFLIKKTFEKRGVFFHLTGLQDATTSIQLHNFAQEFSDVFCKGKSIATPKTWFDAFQLLRKELKNVPSGVKIILFFDELPWLANKRSNFLQALDFAWNQYFSDIQDLVLLVCGSAASWMVDNVLNAKGGLHGRPTHQMRLLPFTLGETEKFLQSRNIHLDRKQIIELYMCIGGVAKYLTYVERGLPAAQIVGRLCFSFNGPLVSEFHKLYRSLFKNYQDHVEIVKAIGAYRNGLSYGEIVSKTGLISGGSLSKKIEELTESGFLIDVPIFGKTSQEKRYVLVDEFSIFHLHWSTRLSAMDIQNRGSGYWEHQYNTSVWRGWAGLAFETICLKHITSLKQALGLAAVQTASSKWKYSPKADEGGFGAEIDLVIDRADRCINLCEMKFCNDSFVIDKAYAEQLRRKKACFTTVTDTRKAVFTTLVTTFGAKQNPAFLSAVDQQVTMDSLFSP